MEKLWFFYMVNNPLNSVWLVILLSIRPKFVNRYPIPPYLSHVVHVQKRNYKLKGHVPSFRFGTLVDKIFISTLRNIANNNQPLVSLSILGRFDCFFSLSTTWISYLIDSSSLWSPFFGGVFLLRRILFDAKLSNLLCVVSHCEAIFRCLPTADTTKWHVTPLTHESSATMFACEGTIAASLPITHGKFHHGVFNVFLAVSSQIFQLLTHQRLNKQCFVLNNVQWVLLPLHGFIVEYQGTGCTDIQ